MCQVIHTQNNTTKETMHNISVVQHYLNNRLCHHPHIVIKSLYQIQQKNWEIGHINHQYKSKIG